MSGKRIVVSVTLIALLVIAYSIYMIYYREPVEPIDALTVSVLLKNPQYDLEVRVYGRVSLLGELFCPCFELTSNGEKITVWYDLIIEDDGTERPSVSVDSIKNGNLVIVTGELKSEGQHVTPKDFWSSKIEKIE